MPGLEGKAPVSRMVERTNFEDKVADLIDKVTCNWKQEVLINMFNENEICEIKKLKFPQVDCEDRLCWTAIKDGTFSVNSFYNLLANDTRRNESVWRLIWDSKLHDRLKLFLWRLASNIIPVNMVVANKIRRGDRKCSLCGSQEMDILHLFRDYHVSRALAFASKWSLQTSTLIEDSPQDFVKHVLSSSGGNYGFLDVLVKVCFLYYVWMLRNGVVYGGIWDFESDLFKFESMVEEFNYGIHRPLDRAAAKSSKDC